jgi:hypothetical protein
MSIIPALERLRQLNYKFKTNMGCIATFVSIEPNTKTPNQTNRKLHPHPQ